METRQSYINSANRDNSYFQNIDTKDKAYILGFILGDGAISDRQMEISVAEKDKSLMEYFCEELTCTLSYNGKTDRKKRIFPRYRTSIGNREFLKHLKTKVGGTKKKGRRFPRISKNLMPYLILGFFDADGCITWGVRKDRDRLWQKVSFTADISILSGLQNILSDYDIAMQLRPKKDEDVYVLEITNELNVFKIFELLPLSFSKINRKRDCFIDWVDATVNKYTFNVGDYVSSVDRRTLKKHSKDELFVGKFKGNRIISIDNDIANVENIGDVNIAALSKKGLSNYALRLKLDENGENY